MWQAAQVMSSTSSPIAGSKWRVKPIGSWCGLSGLGSGSTRKRYLRMCAGIGEALASTTAARDSRTSRNAPHRPRRPAASTCPARCSSSAAATRRSAPRPSPGRATRIRRPAPGRESVCTGHTRTRRTGRPPRPPRRARSSRLHFSRSTHRVTPCSICRILQTNNRATGWRLCTGAGALQIFPG